MWLNGAVVVPDLYAADPCSRVYVWNFGKLCEWVGILVCVCWRSANVFIFRTECEWWDWGKKPGRYRKSSDVEVRPLLSHATVLQTSLSDKNVWKSQGIVIYCLQLQCFVCVHACTQDYFSFFRQWIIFWQSFSSPPLVNVIYLYPVLFFLQCMEDDNDEDLEVSLFKVKWFAWLD